MTKFYKVTSANCYKTPTIINIDHIVMIQPLGDGEWTSVLLDNGSYYTIDTPFDTVDELLGEYIVDVCYNDDEKSVKKASDLHEQFKEVFGI